ncbi:hypothetical protein SLE2022_405990 [Rubroshorea leprosula]
MFEADRQRLGHRGEIVVEPVRHLDQRILVEQHEFAPAARAFVREADHGVAAARAHHRHRHDAPPDRHGAAAAGPVIDHLADIFVAGHEGPGEIERGIGAAEPAREIDHRLPGVEECWSDAHSPQLCVRTSAWPRPGTGSATSPTATSPFCT